jgi:hypothetical protein
MAHLNQCLLWNIEKTQQCCIRQLNPSFLFDFITPKCVLIHYRFHYILNEFGNFYHGEIT